MRRPISTRERVDIFTRANGICHICGETIDGTRDRWEVEHVIALEMGGDEAKGSPNLQPAHVGCHKVKTAVDAWAIAKAKRREARHIGANTTRSPLPCGRGSKWKKKINGAVERRQP